MYARVVEAATARPLQGEFPRSDPVAAIRVENVTVSYNSFLALRQLTLSVHEGELLTVLGPSGSGKSTLLNIIAGSVQPDSGSIWFGKEDVTFLPPHKRRIGMVFQRYTLFPNRTVAENVAFPLEIRKTDVGERKRLVSEALELVGLTAQADRYPSQISGGQAQRAALARAIVFGPAMMLMDEPLGALDRALRKNLQFEIRALQQRLRVPTLYVTHDQEEAMSLSDRIVIVRDGEIFAEGSPRELYQNPKTVWTANFLGDANCLPTGGLTQPGWAVTVGGQEVPVSSKENLKGPAKILIRPEDCKISRQALPGRSYHPATVKWVEYLGSIQKVRLTCFGTELSAQLSGQSEGYEPGENVFVGWDTGDATLVEDR